MAHHQVMLEGFDVFVGNADVAQRAEAGIDAVVQLTGLVEFAFQVVAAVADLLPGFVGQGQGAGFGEDDGQRIERKRRGTDVVMHGQERLVQQVEWPAKVRRRINFAAGKA